MNTRLLMRASAVFLGLLGASAVFLPQEILARAGTPPVGVVVVLVQIAGALWLGFGMLNWMAQGSVIGGIHGRPVAIGNLAHFTIGALSLVNRFWPDSGRWKWYSGAPHTLFLRCYSRSWRSVTRPVRAWARDRTFNSGVGYVAAPGESMGRALTG